MQTFLPRVSFSASAVTLDDARLNKQILETYQILQALITGEGYIHHPATLMWVGYERALCDYGSFMSLEYNRRHRRIHACAAKFAALSEDLGGPWREEGNFRTPRVKVEYPPWLGDPAFHGSHRSNLVRKDPDRYGPLFPGQPSNRPYLWPVLDKRFHQGYYLAISKAEMGRQEQWELPSTYYISHPDAKGRGMVFPITSKPDWNDTKWEKRR